MQRILVGLMIVIFLGQTLAESAAAAMPPTRIAPLDATYVSMTVQPDGTTVFLAADGRLTLIKTDGTRSDMALPPLPDGTTFKDWSDLAWNGKEFLLIRFNESACYRFDPNMPGSLHVQALSGIASEKPMPAELDWSPKGLTVLDAQSGTYAVDARGQAVHLEPGTMPLRTPEGVALRVVSDVAGQGQPWEIRAGDQILCRLENPKSQPGAEPKPVLQLLKPIGFDSKGRLLALEGSGKGERDTVYRLLIVADGQVIQTADLPDLSPQPMVRALAPMQGTALVYLARNAQGNQHLMRLPLP